MCGIWGIINTKKRKFDKSTFNVLGVNNDSRGGDSCGIYIDGKLEYGVDKEKKYENFYPTSKVLKLVNECQIALGHCRKASVGTISKETAQPVVITNENNEVEYVLMHNGTIHNYKELATKYIPNIDIKGMTDSQVMANIFYNCGYDVLTEYMGAGVFVMVDYRENGPVVYAFKGESKYSVNSVTTSEERPFCYIQNNKELIFSSINTYLKALRPDDKCYTIPSNTLVELSDAVYAIEEYKRDNCYQTSYTPSTYNSWDDYVDYGYAYKYITYVYHTFKLGQFDCDGVYYANRWGKVNNKEEGDFASFYFYGGALLRNKTAYDFLEHIEVKEGLTIDDVMELFFDLIVYFSVYPVYDHAKSMYVMYDKKTNKIVPAEGTFPYLFTTEMRTFEKGRVKTLSYLTNKETYDKSMEYIKSLDNINNDIIIKLVK